MNDTDDPLDDLDEGDWSFMPYEDLGQYHEDDDHVVRAQMTCTDVAWLFNDTRRSTALQELIDRDGRWCGICHRWLYDLTQVDIDHVVPRAAGGCDHLENKQLAHRKCNNRKSAKTTGWEDEQRRIARGVPLRPPCAKCSDGVLTVASPEPHGKVGT